MGQETKYRVVLIDAEGYEIGERPADNLREARAEMRYMLSDQYAKVAETTHETMGTCKVEVQNARGECILDEFYCVNL